MKKGVEEQALWNRIKSQNWLPELGERTNTFQPGPVHTVVWAFYVRTRESFEHMHTSLVEHYRNLGYTRPSNGMYRVTITETDEGDWYIHVNVQRDSLVELNKLTKRSDPLE